MAIVLVIVIVAAGLAGAVLVRGRQDLQRRLRAAGDETRQAEERLAAVTAERDQLRGSQEWFAAANARATAEADRQRERADEQEQRHREAAERADDLEQRQREVADDLEQRQRDAAHDLERRSASGPTTWTGASGRRPSRPPPTVRPRPTPGPGPGPAAVRGRSPGAARPTTACGCCCWPTSPGAGGRWWAFRQPGGR